MSKMVPIVIDEYTQAACFTYGRSGYANPDRIVLHHWGNDGQKHDNVVAWFKMKSSYVSAHFVVSDTRVTQMVSLNDTAWHAGNWDWNCRSIGIEARPEHDKTTQETVAKLVAQIWTHYGKLPLYEHREIVATGCPGRWKKEEVKAMAEKYYKEYTAEKTSSSTKKTTKTLTSSKITAYAKQVIRGDYGNGDARVTALKKQLKKDGYAGTDAEVKKIQAKVNALLA